MPKVRVTYDLPDEQYEFDLIQKAGKYKSALWELDQHLKKLVKYGDLGFLDKKVLMESHDITLYDDGETPTNELLFERAFLAGVERSRAILWEALVEEGIDLE